MGKQKMTMKDFKKHFIIPAEPEEVYAALTNPATLRLWTGEVAEMSTEPGSEFSLWEESIVGKNLEFEPGRKIVQQWYFGEDEETPSIVTIILHPSKKGTDAELKHTNIPDEAFEDITTGWQEAYFGALIDFYTE
ncbi:SRPBCC domain-containing protein [Chitinophaga qingshengii]|nr:SRPBCC domain-containing protein [Chitinophaga qingshengii]